MNIIKVNLIIALLAGVLSSCSKSSTAEPFVPVNPTVDSLRVPQYGTPFNKVPDPRDVVIYQVNMRVFSQQGDFAGVVKRLDNIKSLGANTIYLMPIYPVGTEKALNSPYCIKDYTQVNTEFGNLQQLRTLVDEAHNRGLTVILDWVANHTAWDHVWMKQHKDWYLQDNNGNVVSPPGTGWNDVAQLNFGNKNMRLAMISAMRYWVLAANVDGFRCDYTDGPPVDFWQQATDSLRKVNTHTLLLMAEGSRPGNFNAGFQYNFGFGYFGYLKRIFEQKAPVSGIDSVNNAEYAQASDAQRMVRYTTNHDVNGSDGTPEELFGGKRGAMAAFVATAFMKNVPMVYNGQEVATPHRLTFPFTSTKIDWSLNPDVTVEYSNIINKRQSLDAVKRGEIQYYNTADICAYVRTLGTQQVLVLVNMRNTAETFHVPTSLQGTQWTNVFTNDNQVINATVAIAPFEYIVLKRN
ncbi:glycosidase [Chitinophaga skermanii]|uniref:Glycosidase n=1 Tax=Chitinophaga skermanii TaxID=331697 RepID=A0A327QGC9_9BACT|nr:alpha-amylase family glycosyl hydrolase [Chitinophaga skermanii]RAJ02373.1 glycosidase [Chitinophaga skermanii]